VREGSLNLVFLGLSVTSSWGNGHATTYRALIQGLVARGHQVLFLERNVPWYAHNRDLKRMSGCRIELYRNLRELQKRFAEAVRAADFVMVGSYVPQGIEVGQWVLKTARAVTAFYDIDTPVTLACLEKDRCDYISRALVRRYDLYLSFTGGPTLKRIEKVYGSPVARALYCSVDPQRYFPEEMPLRWDLGYLGTYSPDRQPGLETLLLEPARQRENQRFIVAGPQYPRKIAWPRNVARTDHLPPGRHRRFYNRQKLTLNINRANIRQAGYSPSVRLFEAAACGTPIISDDWPGLERFFEPEKEILVARETREVLDYLTLSQARRRALGRAARKRVLAEHTAAARALQLEQYILERLGRTGWRKSGRLERGRA
jgi:spore maturation protein CgeB